MESNSKGRDNSINFLIVALEMLYGWSEHPLNDQSLLISCRLTRTHAKNKLHHVRSQWNEWSSNTAKLEVCLRVWWTPKSRTGPKPREPVQTCAPNRRACVHILVENIILFFRRGGGDRGGMEIPRGKEGGKKWQLFFAFSDENTLRFGSFFFSFGH